FARDPVHRQIAKEVIAVLALVLHLLAHVRNDGVGDSVKKIWRAEMVVALLQARINTGSVNRDRDAGLLRMPLVQIEFAAEFRKLAPQGGHHHVSDGKAENGVGGIKFPGHGSSSSLCA